MMVTYSQNVPKKFILVNPVVSVGIPTYNRPDGLRRTLQCITEQTYKNLEIIVADNCSPGPETEAVVNEFMAKDARIRYYRHEENYGWVFNFKFVYEKATGEYFMWAADDDEMSSTFVSALLAPFEKYSGISSVMCAIEKIDESGILLNRTWLPEFVNSNDNQFKMALWASCHADITLFISGLFKREELKNYKNQLDNVFGKDMILITELWMTTKFYYVDDFLFTKHIDNVRNLKCIHDDRFKYLKLFLHFGPHLIISPYIPNKRKLWLPFMIASHGVWIGKIYAMQSLVALQSLVRGKKSTMNSNNENI
jgi:glycosyltransferase involved in cell wall biosynthesis